MHPVLLIGLVFLSALALTGLATRYAHWRGMIDEPGDRHSHTKPTPRGGGIGIVLALCLALAWIPELRAAPWLTAILPGMLVLSALGWWDDHASLSARIRFLVQLVVSFVVLGLVFGEDLMQNPGWTLLCLLALVWMTNLYNFMDGSNGLAGAQGVFAGGVLAGLFCAAGNMNLAAASAVIAAACLGFLPWNLGKARVFMGDTGSLALGFGFGSLLVAGVSSGDFSLPVACLVMLLFIADATLTLMARVLRGEQWYNPHRQHVYQRLIASGWTHGRVLILYQTINLLLLLPGILLAVRYPDLAWAMTLVLVLIFGTGWYLMTRKTGVLV